MTTSAKKSSSHEPHNEKSNSDEDTLSDSDSVSSPPTPKGPEASSDEFKSPKVNISIKNQAGGLQHRCKNTRKARPDGITT